MIDDRPPRGHSAGAQLRSARERQGLHIAALAAAIKVSQRKLEALEADRYDELPDATFTRALAQTVCRTLKIDARPVLAELPPVPTMPLEPERSRVNTPFRERPGREEPGLRLAVRRPLVWAASLLLLGAVVLYWWPAGFGLSLLQRMRPSASTVAVPASAPDPVMPPAPIASEPVMATEPPAPVMAQVPAGPAEAASSPAAQVPAPPVAATTAAAPAPAAASAPTPAATAAGIVQLRSTTASWMQARDARGQLLLSRTVVAGETVGLDGALPIRLTIGNAVDAQLAFRGQPVDLKPSTRDNVARIELQ